MSFRNDRRFRAHTAAAAQADRRPPGSPRHITIVDLGPNDCRWPVNDDMSNAEYCGLPCREASAVYCADHHRRGRRAAAGPARHSPALPMTVALIEHFLAGKVTLHCGDCLEVLAGLDACSIDLW